MDKQEKPTFKLKLLQKSHNDTLAWGFVFGNPRFSDGQYIHTSNILKHEGDTIETLNSIYLVIDEEEAKRLSEQSRAVVL